MADNKDNIKLISRTIEKNLFNFSIGETFAQPNPDIDLHHSLEFFKSSIGNNTITVFYDSESLIYWTEDNEPIYSTLDSVRWNIANQLCQNNAAKVVVFYGLPSEKPLAVFAYGNAENDRILKELHHKNLHAKGKKEDLKEVAHEIEEQNDPDDYRFTYELMKSRIYGKKHQEDFDLLAKAAEIAIDNGQALYLLDRIEEEKDKELWKLSHGHSSQWHPIIEALEQDDKELLEVLQDEAKHGHH